MNTIKTNLTTEAIFSDDGLRRYTLKKTWDSALPKLAIVMLAPAEASGIVLDNTTQLCLNNSARMGYGSIEIVNLFSRLNCTDPEEYDEEDDADNIEAIVAAAKTADLVVYAPGTGKAKCKVFQERQKDVLNALRPFAHKLNCLCNESGRARLQHPLSPSLRNWTITPFEISELISEPVKEESKPKRKPHAKSAKENKDIE